MLESHEYGKRMKRDFPTRWKIYNWIYGLDISISVRWRIIKEFFYWKPRWKWFDRYNCIEIPTLEARYHDKPEIMLHGMFALLVDYVEKEKPYLHIQSEEDAYESMAGNDGWKEAMERNNKYVKTVNFLYDWWKRERGERPDPYEESHKQMEYMLQEVFPEFRESECIFNIMALTEKYPNHPEVLRYNELNKLAWELEDAYHKEDENMLIELIKIRRGLWT